MRHRLSIRSLWIPTEVVHSLQAFERQPQFVVCNSESRKDDAGAAQQKIFDIASALLRAHYLPFYKKLDSTLEGSMVR